MYCRETLHLFDIYQNTTPFTLSISYTQTIDTQTIDNIMIKLCPQ